MKHQGGCHCGAIVVGGGWEVELDLAAGASACNCTMCTMTKRANVIVKPAAFTLLKGEADLTDYSKPGNPNHSLFCKHCGVHSFGRGHASEVPQVGGDYVSVNANCLDGVDPAQVELKHWDGRHNNWQAGTRTTPWPVNIS